MVNIDVPAGVGAPPFDTQHPILMDNLQHGIVLSIYLSLQFVSGIKRKSQAHREDNQNTINKSIKCT